ncbi:MAG: hypothetical protein ABWY11_01555 [Umezawaea sp.]
MSSTNRDQPVLLAHLDRRTGTKATESSLDDAWRVRHPHTGKVERTPP